MTSNPEEAFNIIVVDDSQFSREQVSGILTQYGFEVTGQFSNANEALQFIYENSVQLAIIDVVMPKISGFELAQKIQDKFKKTKVVMISSLSQERVVLEAIASGAHDFIQKPIQESVLIDSVKKVYKIHTEDR